VLEIPILEESRGKIKLLSTHNFSRKFAAVCRKSAPTFLTHAVAAAVCAGSCVDNKVEDKKELHQHQQHDANVLLSAACQQNVSLAPTQALTSNEKLSSDCSATC